MLSPDFFNVFKTSLIMMHSRGYDEAESILEELSKTPKTQDFSEISQNFENIGWDFKKFLTVDIKEASSRFKNSYVLTNEKDKKKAFVIFGISTKPFLIILTSIILSYRNSEYFDEYEAEFIFVLNKMMKMKPTLKLEELASQVNFQSFFDMELCKPPIHSLGPFRYEKMTEEEVNTLLEESYLSRKQLKKIFSSDPVVKFLGFPKKTVIRIRRTPMILGSMIRTTIDYRLVV